MVIIAAASINAINFFMLYPFPRTNLLCPAHLIPVFYVRCAPAELRLYHAHRIKPCFGLKPRFCISVVAPDLPCNFVDLPVNFDARLIGDAIPVDCTDRKSHLVYFRHTPEKQTVCSSYFIIILCYINTIVRVPKFVSPLTSRRCVLVPSIRPRILTLPNAFSTLTSTFQARGT